MSDETLMTDGQNTQTAESSNAEETGASQVTEGEQTTETTQATDDAATQQGEKEGEESSESKGDAESKGAPDKYDFQAPEGQELDEGVINAFSDVAKDLNLSQEAAQQLIDKVSPAMQARQAEAIENAHKEWAESSKADKEFGGDKLNENLAVAKKAMDTFGTPELTQLLNDSGLGNHPEIIRAFYRAGKAISEDTFVGGKSSAKGDDSMAKRMYPDMN